MNIGSSTWFIFLSMAIWLMYAVATYWKVWRKNSFERINTYRYNSIPTVFTTLGVLGTFVGIFIGLIYFDVDRIQDSIPDLLQGLKTAFITSIVGIILSIITSKINDGIKSRVERDQPLGPTGETTALYEISDTLKNTRVETSDNFSRLNRSLTGDDQDSLGSQLVRLRNQFTEFQSVIVNQSGTLESIRTSLGGDDETSLLSQIQKLRAEQNDYSRENSNNIISIKETMNSNSQLLQNKFENFSELLAKNNTEALVDVMKKVTEEFNSQMNALIEKLVKENFDELNRSVERMNTWQAENKEMISMLTNEFKTVSTEFRTTSDKLREVTENTAKLTDSNSHLTRLIEELQKVMIEDTKYQEIVNNLTSTVETIKSNTEAFDETTEKLNLWVRSQMNFTDSVASLLVRLEEIDKIKDINEVFWKDTKKQLDEGVGIISTASEQLNRDLEGINDQFYARLNETLQNLDMLIDRIIENHQG